MEGINLGFRYGLVHVSFNTTAIELLAKPRPLLLPVCEPDAPVVITELEPEWLSELEKYEGDEDVDARRQNRMLKEKLQSLDSRVEWLEHVRCMRSQIMNKYCLWIDEEGKLKGNQYNLLACILARNTIVGPVLFLPEGMVR